MPYWYFDTSALVKHYVREPGSIWISTLVYDHSQIIFSSDVAIAETSAAFAILNRTGQLPRPVLRQALANFYQDTSLRYQLATLTRALAFRAAQLAQQYPLKGYDPFTSPQHWRKPNFFAHTAFLSSLLPGTPSC